MQTPTTTPKPDIQHRDAFKVAGFDRRYTYQTMSDIPNLWHEFGPMVNHISGQVGEKAYGVCHSFDEGGFSYMAAVEISSTDSLPVGFATLDFPTSEYAVFTHPGSVKTLRETLDYARVWLEENNRQTDGQSFFEQYGEAFDPSTGSGDITVWYPLTK